MQKAIYLLFLFISLPCLSQTTTSAASQVSFRGITIVDFKEAGEFGGIKGLPVLVEVPFINSHDLSLMDTASAKASIIQGFIGYYNEDNENSDFVFRLTLDLVQVNKEKIIMKNNPYDPSNGMSRINIDVAEFTAETIFSINDKVYLKAIVGGSMGVINDTKTKMSASIVQGFEIDHHFDQVGGPDGCTNCEFKDRNNFDKMVNFFGGVELNSKRLNLAFHYNIRTTRGYTVYNEWYPLDIEGQELGPWVRYDKILKQTTVHAASLELSYLLQKLSQGRHNVSLFIKADGIFSGIKREGSREAQEVTGYTHVYDSQGNVIESFPYIQTFEKDKYQHQQTFTDIYLSAGIKVDLWNKKKQASVK